MFSSILLNIDFDWAPLVLRVVLGAGLMLHGYPKIFKARHSFQGWLESLGFKPGWFWGWVVAFTEFVGGAFLILGFLTELAALFVVIEFFVIMFKLKWGMESFIMKDGKGWELDALYFVIALSLIFSGPGYYSLDWWIVFGL